MRTIVSIIVSVSLMSMISTTTDAADSRRLPLEIIRQLNILIQSYESPEELRLHLINSGVRSIVGYSVAKGLHFDVTPYQGYLRSLPSFETRIQSLALLHEMLEKGSAWNFLQHLTDKVRYRALQTSAKLQPELSELSELLKNHSDKINFDVTQIKKSLHAERDEDFGDIAIVIIFVYQRITSLVSTPKSSWIYPAAIRAVKVEVERSLTSSVKAVKVDQIFFEKIFMKLFAIPLEIAFDDPLRRFVEPENVVPFSGYNYEDYSISWFMPRPIFSMDERRFPSVCEWLLRTPVSDRSSATIYNFNSKKSPDEGED